jgi:hypothetical protein
VADDQTLFCPVCSKECKGKRGLRAHSRVHDRDMAAKPQVDEKPAAAPKATPEIEPKKYVCKKKCFHNGRLYRRGMYYYFTDDYPKDKEGNMLHFEEVDPDNPPPPPEMSGVIVNEEEIPL